MANTDNPSQRVGETMEEELAELLTVRTFTVSRPKEPGMLSPGAQRLKGLYSHIPFYAKAAQQDGDAYWENLHAHMPGV